MHQVIYRSKASRPLDQVELNALITKASQRNKVVNLTGLLLYRSQVFFQILEGDQNDIDTLYQKILKDPLHRDIELLYRSDIKERRFADWSMHLVNLDADDSFLDVLKRHPKIAKSEDYYSDPMNTFALLYDIQYSCRNEEQQNAA